MPYGTKVTAVAAYKLNGSRSALTVKTADKIQLVAPTITLDAGGDVVMTTPTVNREGKSGGAESDRYPDHEGCLLSSDGLCLALERH